MTNTEMYDRIKEVYDILHELHKREGYDIFSKELDTLDSVICDLMIKISLEG